MKLQVKHLKLGSGCNKADGDLEYCNSLIFIKRWLKSHPYVTLITSVADHPADFSVRCTGIAYHDTTFTWSSTGFSLHSYVPQYYIEKGSDSPNPQADIYNATLGSFWVVHLYVLISVMLQNFQESGIKV